MTQRMKAVLCMVLALVLCAPATVLGEGAVNAVFYTADVETGVITRRAFSGAAVGDTLYLLAQDAQSGEVALERWTAGMAVPEVVLTGFTRSTWDAENKPLPTNLSRLFASDGVLYGFDGTTQSVRLLVDAGGTAKNQPLCVLSAAKEGAESSGMEEDGYGYILSLCAKGGTLYLLREEYATAVTRTLRRYDLQTGALVRQETLDHLRQLAPGREGSMLALWQENDTDYNEETGEQNPFTVATFNPETSAAEPIASALSASATGLVYNAKTNIAYFVSNSTVYSLPEGATEPRVSAYLPTQVWQGDGQSLVLLDSGMYASVGEGGVSVRVLDMPGIENGALTIYGEYGSEAHMAVIAAHPELNVTVSSSWYTNMEALTSAMLSGQSTVDILQLNSTSSPLNRLIQKGYAADLHSYPALSDIAAQMDERFTAALRNGEALYGLPVQMGCNAMGYNRKVWEETLGLSESDLPKTFLEFLDFVANFQYDYGDDHPEIQLMSDVQLRTIFLQAGMDQYIASQIKQDGMVRFDTPQFRKLLSALDAVDFKEIDPYAAQGDKLWEDDDTLNELWSKPALFTSNTSVQSPTAFSEGNDFIPLVLPLDEGMEPVIPVDLNVMIINPRTAHMEQAVAYLTEYMQHLGKEDASIVLFPDHNDPVPNLRYESEKLEIEQTLKSYQTALETASEENKAGIRDDIKQMEAVLAEHEKQRISVTAEMIAAYREKISPYLYVMQQTPLSDWGSEASGELQTQLNQYREGAIDAETFIREMDKRVRMMMLEDR